MASLDNSRQIQLSKKKKAVHVSYTPTNALGIWVLQDRK